jgi:hypothetical protein
MTSVNPIFSGQSRRVKQKRKCALMRTSFAANCGPSANTINACHVPDTRSWRPFHKGIGAAGQPEYHF